MDVSVTQEFTLYLYRFFPCHFKNFSNCSRIFPLKLYVFIYFLRFYLYREYLSPKKLQQDNSLLPHCLRIKMFPFTIILPTKASNDPLKLLGSINRVRETLFQRLPHSVRVAFACKFQCSDIRLVHRAALRLSVLLCASQYAPVSLHCGSIMRTLTREVTVINRCSVSTD